MTPTLSRPPATSPIKSANRLDHAVELRPRQLRINRQRDPLARGLLGLGQRPFLITQVREARLAVQRDRIVHGVPDPFLLEVRLELVAPLGAQGVLLEK